MSAVLLAPKAQTILNGWFELRKLTNLSHLEMLDRCTLRDHDSDKPMLWLDLRGLGYHNGSKLPKCHHGGKTNVCWHGTGFLREVLASGCVMKSSAPARCLHKRGRCYHGWYHSPDYTTAYRYAKEKTVLKGQVYSAVFKYDNSCVSSCNRKRRWHYTRHGCLRYAVTAVALVCNRLYRPASLAIRGKTSTILPDACTLFFWDRRPPSLRLPGARAVQSRERAEHNRGSPPSIRTLTRLYMCSWTNI